MAEKKASNVDKTILPDSEKEEVLARINRAARDHPVIKEHHGKWKELIEWADKGNQFSLWDADGLKMSPVKFRKRVKRVVINLMKPLIEAIEGKINMFYRIVGYPNSSEQKDVKGSKVATKINEHIDYDNKIEALNEELKYDMTRTGNAFRCWVPDLDALVEGENGQEVRGRIIGRVPSVFNVRPDTTGKKRNNWRWLVEVAEVTEDELVQKFGVSQQEISNSISDAKKKQESKGTSMGKYYGMHEEIGEKDKEEGTHIIAYYWEKETKKYPEGRLIISLVDTELVFWAKKNPCLGEIPYFKYRYKRYGNSAWGTGPLHHNQPIQRELNRFVSIVSEHLEGWRAKMAIPEGANLKKGAYTTDSFELLEMDMNRGAIQEVKAPELSPQYRVQIDFLMSAFNLVSNVHEVSYSQLPKYASRAPATLFSMMLEQENMKMDPMIREMNQNIRDEAKFKLKLAGRYYKEKRLIKILGENNEVDIEYWKGTDMEGNYDVKLEQGVSLNQSKTVQQRLLMELKGMGAPIEWNKIYKLLQEGDISEELRGDLADVDRATRENHAFVNDLYDKPRKDGGVEIYLHDNHDIHMVYHTNLRKSVETQEWDSVKLAFLDDHIKKHYMFIMALKAMQQQMTGPQNQLPGPQGVESQPSPAEGGVAPEVAETRRMSPVAPS